MIVIDDRETEIIYKIQKEPFSLQEYKQFVVERMSAGDLAIEIDGYKIMGWERKTFRDFVSSWSSKMGRAMDGTFKGDRLSSQLYDVYKTFLYPGLIIELENKESQYGISILDSKVESYLRTLNWGLNVIQFNFIEDTIDYIIKMDERLKTGWRPSITKHIATRDNTMGDIANVCSVLNIGIKEMKGEELQRKYKSLSRFIDEIRLNPEGLLDVEGIGKKTVEKLKEKFA